MIIYIQIGKNDFGIKGQVLQSRYLEFNHPITKEKMMFEKEDYDEIKKIEREENRKRRKYNMRIQKYIAETGLCSRRKAEEYIRDGKITVNGKVAVIGQNVEENDIIKYNGKLLKKEELEYYLLNKPLRIYMYK